MDYDRERETRTFTRRVFQWLAEGLLLASATAWALENRLELTARLFTDPGVFWAVMIAALAVVFTLGGWSRRSPGPAWPSVVFLGWSALSGAALSLSLQRLAGAGAAGALLAVSGAFAVGALYGRFFRRDPLSVGGVGLMAVAGMTLAASVDLAGVAGPFDGAVAFALVLAFVLVCAWDAERVRAAGASGDDPARAALSLELDVLELPMSALLRRRP